MLTDKKMLSVEDIDSQTALELPDRETLLVNVILVDVIDLNNNQIAVQVPIGVAANVCGVSVNALSAFFIDNDTVQCDAQNTTAANNFMNRGGGNGGGQ